MAAVLLGAASQAGAAPPKLTGLFPSGVTRGQTATVTASGEFSAWPVDVWVDRPGLTVTAAADQGKLTVAADPVAATGVYWIRLTHAEGASTLRPLIVGTLPEVEEVEPNDAPDKPQVLAGATVIHGRLAKAGDVDMFALRLKQGESVTAAVEANVPFGSPMDGVLQLVWLAGPAYDAATPEVPVTATGGRRLDAFVLDQDDDAAGLDPRLSHVAQRDGWYAIRLFAFPAETGANVGFAGAETYVYRLTISTTGLIEFTLPTALTSGQATSVRFGGWQLPAGAPLDKTIPAPVRDPAQAGVAGWLTLGHDQVPGFATARLVDTPSVVADAASTPEAPQAVPVPSVVSGVIELPRDVDAFAFPATKGRKVRLAVESRTLGFPLDSLLIIRDSTGKVLAENDDTAKGRDSELLFAPPEDGTYVVLVQDVHRHGGPRHVYRLLLTDAATDYGLSLAAETPTLEAGKNLELTVNVDRRDACDQPIELSVLGLPAGLTAAPAVSDPKNDSAKTVKLVLTADAAAKFATRGVPIRIVGKLGGDAARLSLATFATTGGQVHQDAWLTLPAP